MIAYYSSSYRVTDFNSPNILNTYNELNQIVYTYIFYVIFSKLKACLSNCWCSRNGTNGTFLAKKCGLLSLLNRFNIKTKSRVFCR